MLFRTIALLASLTFAGAALAQDHPASESKKEDGAPKKDDDTLKTAGHIVSQPARDVGIDKAKVPDLLARAVAQPYAMPGKGCKPVVAAIGGLNALLGPDFGSNSAENENKFGKLAAAGGEAVVNSLIPLRGIVREVSGAGPADRRLDAAVNAGLARRGFLRGLAVSRGCKLPGGGATLVAKK
jgi:hypothetical protein